MPSLKKKLAVGLSIVLIAVLTFLCFRSTEIPFDGVAPKQTASIQQKKTGPQNQKSPQIQVQVKNNTEIEPVGLSVYQQFDSLHSDLKVSEKKRTTTLGGYEKGGTSILYLKIHKPDQQEINDFTSKIIQLHEEIARSEIDKPSKALLIDKTKQLNDFLHWNPNLSTGKEYNERAVSVHIDPHKNGGDSLMIVLSESTDTISSEGDNLRVAGDASKKFLNESQARDRFGHLFETETLR